MAEMKMAVRGEAGVLALVPAMLGFHPADSLVLMSLIAGLVERVARVDLAGASSAPVVDRFIDHLMTYADEVVLVTYSDDAGPADTVDIETALAVAQVPVLMVINTDNTPVEPMDLGGRVIFPSREALAASVAFDPSAPAGDPVILAAMASPLARDGLLFATAEGMAVDRQGRRAVVDRFVATAVAVADDHPHAADVCALVSALAYLAGNGALAEVALARGLASDPGHRLSGLLQQFLELGLPPKMLARCLTEAALSMPAA